MLRILSRSIFVAGCITLFGFANNLITARALGVEGRGEYASILLLITIAGGVAQLGLGQAFVYQYRADKNLDALKNFYFCLFCSTIIAAILGGVGGNYFNESTSVQPLLISALTAFFSFYSLALACTQIESKLIYYNTIRFSTSFALCLTLLYLNSNNHLSTYNIVAVQTIIFALIGTIGALKIHQSAKRRTRESQVAINTLNTLSLGLRYHLTVMLGMAAVNIDKIYLFLYSANSNFGLYSVAFTTSRLIGALQETISTALFSRFAGKKEENITETVLFIFRISFTPLIVLSLGLGLVSNELIVLIFGNEFSGASTAFSILLLESVIGGASWMLAQQFNATGQPGVVLIRQAVSLLPIVVALPFLPTDNINEWLAALLLISSTTRLLATLAFFKIRLNIPFPSVFPTIGDIGIVLRKLKLIAG
jgi:O-antigen/teichoic acid export membrane protein